MLRITRKAQDSSRLTLIPEGRIASDWVSVLEHECLKAMQEAEVVGLDLRLCASRFRLRATSPPKRASKHHGPLSGVYSSPVFAFKQ